MAAEPEEARMTPRMLRMGAALALLVAILFLPLEYFYPSGSRSFTARAVAHTAHAVIALIALGISYTPFGARRADTLGLIVVTAMGMNALVYLAIAPAFPSLVSNALALLLFGAAVICSWTPLRTALVGTLWVQGFMLVGLLSRQDVPQESFVFSIGALLFASVIAAFCASVIEDARKGIVRREHELESLSNRLMSVQEEERRRLSRELHDGVGQGLTAVVSHLWLVERRLPDTSDDLRSQVTETRALAAKTLAEIRELSQLLRPSLLDDWGLVPSLEAQVKSFRMHHEIEAELHTDELPDRLPPEFETAVFRIVQEALTNVAKHARATTVRVALRRVGGGLFLDVTDNGVGYPRNGSAPTKPGLGLLSIRERVRALGGHVMLSSERGAHLSVVLPMPA
jgi:signal transduction histidine kinase